MNNVNLILESSPDVKGGLDSIKNEISPILRVLAQFIGWGGTIACFFVLLGLVIMVGVKRNNHEVVDKKSLAAIGIVIVVMVVLASVAVWSTFFIR